MIRFTTSKGTFEVELNEKAAPKTVENFKNYVKDSMTVRSFTV